MDEKHDQTGSEDIRMDNKFPVGTKVKRVRTRFMLDDWRWTLDCEWTVIEDDLYTYEGEVLVQNKNGTKLTFLPEELKIVESSDG